MQTYERRLAICRTKRVNDKYEHCCRFVFLMVIGLALFKTVWCLSMQMIVTKWIKAMIESEDQIWGEIKGLDSLVFKVDENWGEIKISGYMLSNVVLPYEARLKRIICTNICCISPYLNEHLYSTGHPWWWWNVLVWDNPAAGGLCAPWLQ